MKARLMGTEPQKKLKPGSVPTIFSFRPEIQTGSSGRPGRTKLRIQGKVRGRSNRKLQKRINLIISVLTN